MAVIALAAGFQHFSASKESGRSVSSAARGREVGQTNGHIAYGTSPKQLLATLGAPATKRGSCWSYNAKTHTFNGEYLGKFIDGLRYCFGEGATGTTAVTGIYIHIIAHRLLNQRWYPGGWNPAVTIMGTPPPPS